MLVRHCLVKPRKGKGEVKDQTVSVPLMRVEAEEFDSRDGQIQLSLHER